MAGISDWPVQSSFHHHCWQLSFFAKKLPKRLIFYRAYNKNEEDEYSQSEFYYAEDLKTSTVKTGSGIDECRGAIDDFMKQKCANTNKIIMFKLA